MATELGRVVPYHEGLPHIKSHDLLIACQCLWTPNFTGQLAYSDRFLPIKSHAIWSRSLKRSRQKLKSLSPPYQNPCGYKTLVDGDLPWGASTHKATWHFITWSCEITWVTISTTTVPMATNLGRMMATHMTLWSRGIAKLHGKLKPLSLHYHRAYSHQTSQDPDLPSVSSTHKVTLPFGHVVLQDHMTN